MKTLVIIGDHPRNLGLLTMMQNKLVTIDCLIPLKEKKLSKTPKNISKKIVKL